MEPPRLPGSIERDIHARTRVSVWLGTVIGLAIGAAYVFHAIGSALAIR
jgi:hypothetical protein